MKYKEQRNTVTGETRWVPVLSTGQKVASFAAKAAPVVGSVIGGVAGTAISPIVGSAAGATAGYAGGRAIGESIQDLAGIQDESAPESVKSMIKESAVTGATSLATGVAFKGLGMAKDKIASAVAPKAKALGKTLNEMVVPAKIKGTSPDIMSKADEIFDIRQKLGLKGAPSAQARQAQAIWESNKKTVEQLLKNEGTKIPGRAIKGSIDDAVYNSVGFDETTNVGKKTVKYVKDVLFSAKDPHQLFIAQQKLGEKAFNGAPTPEKEFMKNIYGKVATLLEESSPAARAKIAENAAIRKLFPSLKSAIGKEGLSATEAIGTTVGALSAPGGLPGKIGTALTGIGLSTKPGMIGLDAISRQLLKAGVKKEATKKLLGSSDFLKAIMSTIPSATSQ